MFLLLTKDENFEWTNEFQQYFDCIKENLISAPIFQGPGGDFPFQIHIDTSNKSIGVVLGQQQEKDPYAIDYINKNLVGFELTYIMKEKEFLVVVYAINKFKHYITRYHVYIHIDHSTIRYLMNKYDVNAMIIRWLLLHQ